MPRKYEELPKTSSKRSEAIEPIKPKVFLFSIKLESYLNSVLSDWLKLISETKIKIPKLNTNNDNKVFFKFSLKFANIN